ncbi:hypothetical protein HNP33_002562 [Comamonas odontotermitis]|uniref:t-SNARE coiled-coil homology domain-containing protein n=1 Tax=Comamonas odontotermitis TaxID=379895 RepID=A0ABR6RH35_9BURK|nr:hypothetical protein [Comamonas odontotermitis]MBB6578480.1 hypothetical protein [Comamonas odontotermitis]
MQDDYGDLLPSQSEIVKRLDAGDSRMGRLEEGLDKNTKATESMARDVAMLVEFLNAMRGAFKVLNWLGRLAKPLGYIVVLATALLSFWAAIKGGRS